VDDALHDVGAAGAERAGADGEGEHRQDQILRRERAEGGIETTLPGTLSAARHSFSGPTSFHLPGGFWQNL
jgi:hypothetical protein